MLNKKKAVQFTAQPQGNKIPLKNTGFSLKKNPYQTGTAKNLAFNQV
ncbi:MAG: hypothetical protein FWD47_00865 [Treponema sp.]|nr:hypothetical protein [Treponema sp.]